MYYIADNRNGRFFLYGHTDFISASLCMEWWYSHSIDYLAMYYIAYDIFGRFFLYGHTEFISASLSLYMDSPTF